MKKLKDNKDMFEEKILDCESKDDDSVELLDEEELDSVQGGITPILKP